MPRKEEGAEDFPLFPSNSLSFISAILQGQLIELDYASSKKIQKSF